MANFRAICSVASLLKMIQIALGIGCIALLRIYNLGFAKSAGVLDGLFSNDSGILDRTLVGHIALGASVLISLPLLFGYIFEQTSGGLEGTYLSIVGSLSVTAGSLAIETYHDQNTESDKVKAGLGLGALMILNGLIYFIDVFCRCRPSHSYNPVTRH